MQPQLAGSAEVPSGEGVGWAYEPKYDGFRALVFAGPDETYVQSRGGKPLARYFPELDFPAGRLRNRRRAGHPRRGRRGGLRRTPEPDPPGRVADPPSLRGDARRCFRVFDVLARDGENLMEKPFAERRAALVELVKGFEGRDEEGPGGWTAGSVELTPLTLDAEAVGPWLENGEGVIAKELSAPYQPGKRKAMVKMKRLRTIDAVVAGWRPGKEANTVGSLMLGLYDARRRRSPRRRPHLRPEGRSEARARRNAGPLRDGRPRLRRSEPMGRRSRPRVGLAAARARDRGELRPRQRRPDPPWRQDPPLAGRQGPGGMHGRPARSIGDPEVLRLRFNPR